jgi:hypothetical protein
VSTRYKGEAGSFDDAGLSFVLPISIPVTVTNCGFARPDINVRATKIALDESSFKRFSATTSLIYQALLHSPEGGTDVKKRNLCPCSV